MDTIDCSITLAKQVPRRGKVDRILLRKALKLKKPEKSSSASILLFLQTRPYFVFTSSSGFLLLLVLDGLPQLSLRNLAIFSSFLEGPVSRGYPTMLLTAFGKTLPVAL